MTGLASRHDIAFPADAAQNVLDAHEGDALAALRSVIADAEFLHDQLAIASTLLSHGIGQGAEPIFVRTSSSAA